MSTPQQQDLHAYPNASLIKRLFALGYDIFILLALSMGYSALATGVMVALGAEDSEAYLPMQRGYWFGIGWLLVIASFYWFFWIRGGQTVGMRAWRLKIIGRDSTQFSHKQCLIRILLGPLSLAAFGLGYLWCLLNKDRAAWHDIASKTRVIQLPKPPKKKR